MTIPTVEKQRLQHLAEMGSLALAEATDKFLVGDTKDYDDLVAIATNYRDALVAYQKGIEHDSMTYASASNYFAAAAGSRLKLLEMKREGREGMPIIERESDIDRDETSGRYYLASAEYEERVKAGYEAQAS